MIETSKDIQRNKGHAFIAPSVIHVSKHCGKFVAYIYYTFGLEKILLKISDMTLLPMCSHDIVSKLPVTVFFSFVVPTT